MLLLSCYNMLLFIERLTIKSQPPKDKKHKNILEK